MNLKEFKQLSCTRVLDNLCLVNELLSKNDKNVDLYLESLDSSLFCLYNAFGTRGQAKAEEQDDNERVLKNLIVHEDIVLDVNDKFKEQGPIMIGRKASEAIEILKVLENSNACDFCGYDLCRLDFSKLKLTEKMDDFTLVFHPLCKKQI